MSREDDIKKLIVQHNDRLQKLKEKQAFYGISVDPSVLLEIEKIETEIEVLQAELASLPEIPRRNPYRGLAAFREEEAGFFFGREAFTEQLVEIVQQKPFVAVLGPSGSGKSSIVFAGLVPKLRRQENWLIVDFRPGSDPFRSLAGVLLPLYETALDRTDQMVRVPKLAAYLRENELPLAEVFTNIFEAQAPKDCLLLIADQFEELYTLCPDPDIRRRFVDTLLAPLPQATRSPGFEPPVHVVLTLRADFLSQALAYRPLADALRHADVKLGPMTEPELCRAIEEPAKTQGVSFEPGLVGRILDDISRQPGHLPLLEFALTELWDRQSQGQLTHAAYEAIGEVEGALSRHAEQVYEGLGEAEQALTRRVFVQLIKPGAGTEDTRRLASKDDLNAAGWQLAQQLAGGEARLVVTGQDAAGQETAEVVHEALIRGWHRLRGWLDEDRTFRDWQERLRFELRQWQATDGDEGALLRGAPLAEAEGWLAERDTDLSQAEQEFIQASLHLRERQVKAREAQRRRIIAISGVIAVLIIALLGFGLWSTWLRAEQERAAAARAKALQNAEAEARATAQAEKERAQRQSQISQAQALAALAPGITNDDELAALLALEAFYTDRQVGNKARWLIDSSLRETLSRPNFSTFLLGHGGGVSSVAFSPDGQWLASGSGDKTIRLWRVGEPMAETEVLTGHEYAVLSVAFSPDGQWLASGSGDTTIRLWQMAEPMAETEVLTGHKGAVNSVAFSPDGQWLASGSYDKTIRLWQMAEPMAETEVLTGHKGAVNSVAFSPDGQWLASGDDFETIRLWRVAEPMAEPVVLTGHEGVVYSVAFSPDTPQGTGGQWLASGSGDTTIRLWQVAEPAAEPVVLTGHEGVVDSVAFSPDGQWLASGSGDTTIRLWQVAEPAAEPVVLTGHEGDVASVAFSPDTPQGTGGQWLASGSRDKTIRLWQVTEPAAEPVVLTGHEDVVRSVAFSPDGQWLASGSGDKTIRLWQVAEPMVETEVLTGHEGVVYSVAFSPDTPQDTGGQRLASGSRDETIRLWQVAEPMAETEVLTGHEGDVWSVAFSPDTPQGTGGQWLASGSEDKTIRLWRVGEPMAETEVLTGHENTVNSVAFSPDGRWLASGSKDGTIRVWQVTEPMVETEVLTGHKGDVGSVAFSPDGRWLASGSWDNTIRLWQVAEPAAEPEVLTGHEGDVDSVAFSPDGQWLASGSKDGTIRLWQVTEPAAEPVVLTGHEGAVWSVAFSPDGQWLASGSKDKTIRLWIVPLEKLVEIGCGQVRRNLSQAEWDRYLPGQEYHRTCSNLPSGEGAPKDVPAAFSN